MKKESVRYNTQQKHMFEQDTAYAWIDGASSGNPGPAGAGVIIKKGGVVIGEWKKYLGHATNNVAEYSSFILALEKSLQLGIEKLLVYTDSELLYRQFIGVYKVRNPGIKKLFKRVDDLRGKFKKLRVEHIPRERNTEADKLARQARTRK